jgi:hypothetical protein
MKKKLVVLVILIICVLKIYAQSECVIIKTMSGESAEYLLSENPKFTYGDNGAIVFTTLNVSIEYSASDIESVRFGDKSTTDIVKTEPSIISISMGQDKIKLFGLSPYEEISIYRIDGTLLKKYKVPKSGSLIIPFREHFGNFGIIKTRNQSFKISTK